MIPVNVARTLRCLLADQISVQEEEKPLSWSWMEQQQIGSPTRSPERYSPKSDKNGWTVYEHRRRRKRSWNNLNQLICMARVVSRESGAVITSRLQWVITDRTCVADPIRAAPLTKSPNPWSIGVVGHKFAIIQCKVRDPLANRGHTL